MPKVLIVAGIVLVAIGLAWWAQVIPLQPGQSVQAILKKILGRIHKAFGIPCLGVFQPSIEGQT